MVLTASSTDAPLNLYPDLDAEVRTRIRARLKQISTYEWPSSRKEDPALRRGYTLHQCCRLAIALQLIDACLPASQAVAFAKRNEADFLTAISKGLDNPDGTTLSPEDPIAVLMPAELQNILPLPGRTDRSLTQMRLIHRKDVSLLWAGELAGPGTRLIVDVVTVASTLWCWLSGRRLMTDAARTDLLTEIAQMQESP